MKKYKINEIFESIQGEGSKVGELCVFIRFAKCNLKCDFCDTDYKSYTEMDADYILKAASKHSKSKNIIFTGGEPLLQLDENLINKFRDKGYIIQVETNGTIDVFFNIDHLTVSPKSSYNWNQKKGTDLKMLVKYDDLDVLEQIKNDTDFENYYLQPIDDAYKLLNIDRAIELIKKNSEWKLSIQMHKYINIQ